MTASTAAPWAVLLPGILMPAVVRHTPLVRALGPEVRAVPKELEVYAHDAPPDDYSVASELAGLERFLDEQWVKRVHLYGHSAGASVALAFAAEHPERVLSLALDEPASDFSREDRLAPREQFPQRLEDLPAADRMRVFAHSLVRPGVQQPAATPPAPGPESAKRPQGLLAFEAALYKHGLDVSVLCLFRPDVFQLRESEQRALGADVGASVVLVPPLPGEAVRRTALPQHLAPGRAGAGRPRVARALEGDGDRTLKHRTPTARGD